MRERALIHVAGPAGAGKTTFIERLLGAEVAFVMCVRAERDPKLRKAEESAPKSHGELRRYREAGASTVALYRFAEPSTDAFFTTAFMQDYSQAVFIEGDCPTEYVDLSVFVTTAPANGRSLLRRVVRDHTPSLQASIEPRDVRSSMQAKLGEVRRAPPPAHKEHWVLEDGYAGIERAQLVVVNTRSDAEQRAAEAVLADVARLRKDEAVYRDVIGWGNKLAVTAVVAPLSNPKDAGLKKALARVKRATKRRSP